MFQPWTKKEVGKFILCFVLFFALVLCTELPGFLSPLYWAIHPVFAAFLAAGPVTCVLTMKRGFGSAAAVPLLWFIGMKLIGELGMPLMWIGALAVIAVAEIVHMALGCKSLRSIRVSAVIAALAPSAVIWPLYFQTETFVGRAAEEMDQAYAAGLGSYGTIGMFILMIVLSVVLAVISERIAEKIMKVRD